MSLEPVSRDRLRSLLVSHGAAPRRRHGQNFLLDHNLLAAIVRDAQVEAGDRVLEIGPGPGLLTRHLLAAGADVVAIEIDRLMRPIAECLIDPEARGKLQWIEADAMSGPRTLSLATVAVLEQVRPKRLVANLPYSVAGPMLGALAIHPNAPLQQVVMVQREMGDRLTSLPGRREYGPLAVLMALCARIVVRRRVPPGAFWPAPKVESALLSIDLKPDRPCPEQLRDLESFLRMAFHNRRKTLANSLVEATRGTGMAEVSKVFCEDAVKKWRAESIEPLQLYDLARRWAGCAQGERYRPGAGPRPES